MDIIVFHASKDPEHHRQIYVNGIPTGWIDKPNFGPGFFISLDHITWNNAPGARFVADAGGGAPKTYVKTFKQAEQRILEAVQTERLAGVTYPRVAPPETSR
jgi:hypothetical protein